jgi:L-alanine-DL-glutamate epimerase-like enolase superfamily enzyme
MKDLNIEHCEEPMPTWNRRDQAKLVKKSSIPIMADESVFHHHDAFQILADGAADMINIKLGKSGGIANAMKIGAITQAADVYCQVGSFSETRLGITALVHFSHAWNNIIHYDLDSPLMLSEDPVIGGMRYNKDWTVSLDEVPGHGATFDVKFLNQFERIVVQ